MFSFALLVAAVVSQPSSPCTPPAPTGCDAWQQTDRQYDVIVKRWTSAVTRTTRVGSWCEMPACYCAWYQCGDRPHACTPISCNYSIQNQTCWTVGITATITSGGQIGIDLAVRLLATLQTAYAFNGQLQYCYAYTQGVVITPHWSDCWTHRARDVWTEAKVQGHNDVAAVSDYWECQLPNGLIVTVRTDCGVITGAKGDATNVENVTVQHTPYPCPVAPPIPGWTGPYNEACCTSPMPAPCNENNPPGQNPCCGCYARQ